MKKIFYLITAMLLIGAANAQEPAPRGANMNYTRLDSKDAKKGGKATVEKIKDFNYHKTASEATNQEYIALHTTDDYISWENDRVRINGMTIRFTLPDNERGESTGRKSALDIFINDQKVTTVNIDSRWAWQYFIMNESMPQIDITDMPMMRFDEVHFRLPKYLSKGDKITIRKSTNDGLDCGIDFIEIEEIPPVRPQSKYSVSVRDFGAVGDGIHDDMPAFRAAIDYAVKNHRSVYVPMGDYALDSLLCLFEDGIVLQGAGMWYTNLYFTNNGIMKGGICANASRIQLSGFYINGINTLRQERNGDYRDYKAIWGNFGEDSHISDIWSEHFECGIWIAGYYPPIKAPTQRLTVSNVRLRNHYADGVNFAEGTSNSIFENGNIRNCGDDGIASWSQTHKTSQCNTHNIFRNSTVELGWRAGGIGMFGGSGHEIYNCEVREMLMSAGIRFTADFPGCALDSVKPMRVWNCTVYKCGTTEDLFHDRLGAIDIHGGARYPLTNIQFENIDIIDSQTDAVQLWGGDVNRISFKNINIRKVGKGYKFKKKMPKSYAIATHNDGSATFENTTIKGAKKFNKKQKTFNLKLNEE